MKILTRAEEQVIQILWKLEKAFVKDIIAEFTDPKPAYNTVSTIIRILEKKGFVSYKAFGKTHQYFPIITKDTYTKFCLNNIVQNYFSDSFQELVSFFTRDKNLSVSELEEIIELIDIQIKRQKGEGNE